MTISAGRNAKVTPGKPYSIDDALNDRQHTVTPVRGGREALRLGVAIYLFEEPVILEPASSQELKRPVGAAQHKHHKR